MIENIGVFTFINGHTVGCVEQREQRLEANHEYTSKYPNYCRSCNGTGQFHAEKDGCLQLKTTDCYCIENSACPRCGKELKGLTCSHCQFVLGQTRGCPPLDCFCKHLYEKLRGKREKV